ncbi:MAG: hypothetical protein HY313_00965 [Acidobacteria bacterium]|nr:hypothetical protein [Acidobacteriota bacterium]
MPYNNSGFTTINKTEPGPAGSALVSAVRHLEKLTGRTIQIPDLDWTLINTDTGGSPGVDLFCHTCREPMPYSFFAHRDGFEIQVSEKDIAANPDNLTRCIFHAVAHGILEREGFDRSVWFDAVKNGQFKYNENPSRTSTKDSLPVETRNVDILKLVL